LTFFVPEDKVSDILNAADIVDIISEAVLLKKAGKNHLGLCPFHSEKTPSFTVSPDKQMFYCFGCGKGGNVFSFLMQHEGMTFPEAARMLARRYGIDIPTKAMSPAQKKKITERERVLSVNKLAAEFYQDALFRTPSGKKGLAYLEKRGIAKDILNSFKLGYAPAGWDNLLNHLSKKGVPQHLAEKSGLIVPNRRNGFYDRFRDRVIFPIFDIGSQVIGFGGRVLDDALPKYLNSPETPVYNKSRSLYGLNLAKQKCREAGSAFIVEGYMDLLSLWQHGIKNVVATLGTALTPEHVRILKGYASKVTLVYDSDEAGLRAARRSVEVFDQGYVDARILVLPSGHDPDSYLLESGPEAFSHLAEEALGAIDFLIESSLKQHGLSIEGKVRVIADMQVPLAAIRDNVARSLYVKSLAEKIGVDDSAILEKVREAVADNHTRKRRKGLMQEVPAGEDDGYRQGVKQPGDTRFAKIERQIVAMMLQFPKMLPKVREHNLLDFFADGRLKSVGQLILDHEGPGSSSTSDLVSKVDSPEMTRLIASLAISDDVWDYDGCLNLIEQFVSRNNLNENTLLQKIKAAEANNDHGLVVKLLKEKQLQIQKKANKKLESVGGEFL